MTSTGPDGRVPVRVRHRLATGLTALVVICSTSCSATAPLSTPFDADHVSKTLADATTALTGHAPNGDETLQEAVQAASTSVADLNRLSDAKYQARYDAAAHDRVEVVGTWLGAATHDLQGDAPQVLVDAVKQTQHDFEAATGTTTSPPDDDATATEALDALTAVLSAWTPNEPADNPALRHAETLRSTLQLAFANAR